MKSVVTGLMAVSVMGFSQPATPAFEVASVKLHPSRPGTRTFTFGPSDPKVSGNRVTFALASVQDLVMFAYGLLDQKQISSPTGLSVMRDLFEIDAVAPADGLPSDSSPSLDQIRLMTQALLADRFQLKLRHETKILPVYNLMVGKNGSKLKPSAANSQPSTRNKNAPSSGDAAKTGTLDFQLEYTHQPVSEIVHLLSGAVRDRVILDKTGLTGFYDFNLDFTADPFDRFGLAQTAAVREQLGLILDRAEEPMDTLVIEDVQSPSKN